MSGKKKSTVVKNADEPIADKPKKIRKGKKADAPSGSATVTGDVSSTFPAKSEEPCAADVAPVVVETAVAPVVATPAPARVARMTMKIVAFVKSFGKPIKFCREGYPHLLVVEDIRTCFFCSPAIDRLGRELKIKAEKNPMADAKTYISYMQGNGYTVIARYPTPAELKNIGL